MDKIEIPSEINYAEIYFTLRCNFQCAYCINHLNSAERKKKELPAEKFIEGANRINWKELPLTIGGGEPTLRKDFYDLVNGLNPSIKIDLLTNCNFDIDTFIYKMSPTRFSSKEDAYKAIRVSYHPSMSKPEALIKKVSILQDAGYSIGIFGINHPLNLHANIQMSELARKSRVYFFIKDFLGEYNNKLFGYYKYPEGLDSIKKIRQCRIQEILIGPNGYIYRCHRDLYLDEHRQAYFPDPNLKLDYKFTTCPNFGECNPCDLKLKTNRFLEMGSCSVEIK
jgi:hypothetical protein